MRLRIFGALLLLLTLSGCIWVGPPHPHPGPYPGPPPGPYPMGYPPPPPR